jgi:hypothetical protein
MNRDLERLEPRTTGLSWKPEDGRHSLMKFLLLRQLNGSQNGAMAVIRIWEL